MKKLAIISSAALFCLALGLTVSLSAQKTATYKGEVMDSPCALLGGHSAMAQKGESDKDCTLRCVKAGGKFALFNPADKSWFTLDTQQKAEPFAGMMVTVTGTVDAATKTLHITTIKAAK
jgi:type 1 fimbria pilin